MSERKTPTSPRIKFFGRLRFPRLEEPKPFEAGGVPRWEATFILDPTNPQQAAGIKDLLESAAALCKEHYGKVPLAIKKLAVTFIPGTPKLDLNDEKNAPDDIRVFCFQDGSAEKWKNYAGYKGNFVVASNAKRLRPDVANRAGKAVKKGEPEYPYEGANVRGSVDFWLLMGQSAQKTGRLLGCNLIGVQFASDNTAFSQDRIEDEFEALEEVPPTEAVSAFD